MAPRPQIAIVDALPDQVDTLVVDYNVSPPVLRVHRDRVIVEGTVVMSPNGDIHIDGWHIGSA